VPDSKTLRAIHLAHLYSVPFENLNIHMGRSIPLDLQWVYTKVVDQRRGGFCYELNGLLGWLLQELGYTVSLLSARSFKDDGSVGPEYDHLLLLVTCPGDQTRWLADVGWGSGFEEPLRVDEVSPQELARSTWRIDRDDEFYSLRQKTGIGGWIRHYQFTLTPRGYLEFSGMCMYHQTAPKSTFTQRKLCTIFTPDGRVTLSGLKLIITKDGVRTEREVPEEEVPEILRRYFGMVL
jgi:N-hydroxyarylamine O-acetyltransferase